ncbi:MAG: MBL fold metallo-hydrolase [Nitrospinota bacterium]
MTGSLKRGSVAIRLRVLGCYGGKEPRRNLTSFLLNDVLLVDAGAAASALTPEEQVRLEAVVLSHAHLDHVGELPFLADNIFGCKGSSLKLVSVQPVLEDVKRHLLNDRIWPDFTALSAGSCPALELMAIEEGVEHQVGGVGLMAVEVNHVVNAVGYIFQDDSGGIVYTGDTGPTERLWEYARSVEDLRAILIEVSFPDRLRKVAESAKHLTPRMLQAEIRKMPPDVPIYLHHIKPRFYDEVIEEVKRLGEPRIQVLVQGETYEFGRD